MKVRVIAERLQNHQYQDKKIYKNTMTKKYNDQNNNKDDDEDDNHHHCVSRHWNLVLGRVEQSLSPIIIIYKQDIIRSDPLYRPPISI